MEVVALASYVAADVGIEGLEEDDSHEGLDGVDVEGEAASVKAVAGVIALSSAFAVDSIPASAFSPTFKALGLSLAILERSSVCVPLTALETVSNVFLTRDMCWLRPADHREAEVFKYRLLVWRPSFCLTWLAFKSHPLRPVILRWWMCLQLR